MEEGNCVGSKLIRGLPDGSSVGHQAVSLELLLYLLVVKQMEFTQIRVFQLLFKQKMRNIKLGSLTTNMLFYIFNSTESVLHRFD